MSQEFPAITIAKSVLWNDITKTILNQVAGFFGINIKNFNKLYRDSSALKDKVDKLTSEYMNDYERKLAISTPSTTPSLTTYINSQLAKDKDKILAIQREVEALNSRSERYRNRTDFDQAEEASIRLQQARLNKEFNEASKPNTSTENRINTIVNGSNQRFTNAYKIQQWKEKNGVQKEQSKQR